MQAISNQTLMRLGKSFLILSIIYFLDAWLLGSFAVMLGSIDQGMYYYSNPLSAALEIPLSEAVSRWVILNVITAILLGSVVMLLMIRVPEFADKITRKKIRYSDNETAGSAKWMPPEKITETLDTGHGKGFLIGTYEGTPLRLHNKGRLNRNVIIFGGPGSGKTWSEILPNCLQAVTNQESAVIVDPKSEIARETLKFFQKNNYNVKVFNLVDMEHSDRWNPLDEVTNDTEAQLFTEVVIANTSVPGIKKMGGDPFWDRAEQNLLKALTMYVKTEYPKEEQNMYSIYNLLATGHKDELDIIFGSLDEDHPAKAPFNIYSQAADTVKGGVIQGLGTRLQVFQNEHVRALTKTSDINLEAPGKELCAYYNVVSDTDSTFDFLSSLYFTFLFIKLTKLGDRNGGRCPVPINFLLDEFCNIGAIPDFKKRIATMRSRGISCTIITQSLPQLENRYPEKAWMEIISCCDTRLFLGISDNETAKYLSESLGESTVEARGIRRSLNNPAVAMLQKSPTRRRLMTMDEVLRMDETKAILIIRGRNPLMVEKLAYTEHPLAGQLEKQRITEYIPAYKTPSEPEIEIDWGTPGDIPTESTDEPLSDPDTVPIPEFGKEPASPPEETTNYFSDNTEEDPDSPEETIQHIEISGLENFEEDPDSPEETIQHIEISGLENFNDMNVVHETKSKNKDCWEW